MVEHPRRLWGVRAMTDAFQCDVCGKFKQGEATLRMDLELNVGGGSVGLFGGMFNSNDAAETIDLCSVLCCKQVDLEELRASLLDELEDESNHSPEAQPIDVPGGEAE
jgi:hypothetical protein